MPNIAIIMAAKSEVNDLNVHFPVFQENIIKLDISVNYVVIVQVGNSVNNLPEDVSSRFFIKFLSGSISQYLISSLLVVVDLI